MIREGSLKKKLRRVFDRSHPINGPTNENVARFRYIPKAFERGPGWGVWDRKMQRYLETKEVKSLSVLQLDEPWGDA